MRPILAPLHRAASIVVEAARSIERTGDNDGAGFAGAYLAGFADGTRIALADPLLAGAILEAASSDIGLDGAPARQMLEEFRAAVR